MSSPGMTNKRQGMLNGPRTSLELVERSGRGDLSGSLCTLAHHLGGFVATDTSTPLTTLFLIFVIAE